MEPAAQAQQGEPRSREGANAPIMPAPTRTLLLDNYDSYTYNLCQLLCAVNGGGQVSCGVIQSMKQPQALPLNSITAAELVP